MIAKFKWGLMQMGEYLQPLEGEGGKEFALSWSWFWV